MTCYEIYRLNSMESLMVQVLQIKLMIGISDSLQGYHRFGSFESFWDDSVGPN
jgi:hypothetical protein